MSWSELLNPFYVYRKRHRIVPFIVDELGGKLRCQSAALRLFLTDNERRLAHLRGIHTGRKAFIIGTGPSLRSSDLDRLHGELTFASNKIFLAFDRTDWRPTYYLAEDGLSVEAATPYFSALDGVTKLFPFRRRALVGDLKDTLFFNSVWRPFYPKLPGFGTNAVRAMFWGGTVTYTLIQFAIYTGIREMYLIGVDFSYPGCTVPQQGNEAFAVRGGSHGHFHPQYYQSGELIYPPNLHFQELAYRSAYHHSRRLEANIYNATRGGQLEVFPRVSFDDLFPE